MVRASKMPTRPSTTRCARDAAVLPASSRSASRVLECLQVQTSKTAVTYGFNGAEISFKAVAGGSTSHRRIARSMAHQTGVTFHTSAASERERYRLEMDDTSTRRSDMAPGSSGLDAWCSCSTWWFGLAAQLRRKARSNTFGCTTAEHSPPVHCPCYKEAGASWPKVSLR
jgi:hypothetical protein